MASKRKKSRSKKGDRSGNAAAAAREPESAAEGDEGAPRAPKKQQRKKKKKKTTTTTTKTTKTKTKKSRGARSRKAATEATELPTHHVEPPEDPPVAARVDEGTPDSGDRVEAHDLDGSLDDDEAGDVHRLIAAAAGDVQDHARAASPATGSDDPGVAAAAEATETTEAAEAAEAAREDGVAAGDGEPEPSSEEEEKEKEEPAEDLDLGPTSTPEDRARILAAALAHAEMQEARYRVPTASSTVSRLKAGLALVLFAVAGLLVIAPPSALVPEPPASLTAADRLSGLRLALLLQAEQIEAFRAREERLPRSLDEVETRVPGVRFVRSSNRLYQLIAYTPEGRAIVYDSSAPGPEFRALEPSWRSPEGP